MRRPASAAILLLAACGAPTTAAPCPEPGRTGGEASMAEPSEGETADGPATPRAPTVITAEAAERRVAPNGRATITFLARGNNAFMARLEMEPNAEVPEHRDATEETIHVLEGSGVMHIDGVEHQVTAGTTVYMPANALVRFRNGDARLVAIQIFAGPEPAAKYDSWH